MLPYGAHLSPRLLATIVQQSSRRSLDAEQELSWLGAVCANQFSRVLALAAGQDTTNVSAVTVQQPLSPECGWCAGGKRPVIQRLDQKETKCSTDNTWCDLAWVPSDSGDFAAVVRISSRGILDVAIATDNVAPSWQLENTHDDPVSSVSLVHRERHTIGKSPIDPPAKLLMLVGKKWEQRSCVVVSRGDTWDLEVRQLPDESCIQKACLGHVKLDADWSIDLLPDPLKTQDVSECFVLKGRVFDVRSQHVVDTSWVFKASDNRIKSLWVKRLQEAIGAAAYTDKSCYTPFQLVGSRLFQGTVITHATGWHALSFAWLRELDDTLEKDSSVSDLTLSSTVVDTGSLAEVHGCVSATNWEQNGRIGGDFAVFGLKSEVHTGSFWRPATVLSEHCSTDPMELFRSQCQTSLNTVRDEEASVQNAGTKLLKWSKYEQASQRKDISFSEIESWVSWATEPDNTKPKSEQGTRCKHNC